MRAGHLQGQAQEELVGDADFVFPRLRYWNATSMLGQMGFSEACGNFLPRRHFSRCESQGNEASGTRSYYRSEAARQQVAHTLPPQGGGLTSKKKQPTAHRSPYKPVFIFRAANQRTFCLPTRSERLEVSGGQLRSFFSIFSCTRKEQGQGREPW